LFGRTASIRRLVALPVCRANDPRCLSSVTGGDALQASGAVLTTHRATNLLAHLLHPLLLTAGRSCESGGMAARYRSGYLVSRRRGALSHAEALATGETPSPGNRSTSRGLLYSRDLSGSPLLFSVRVAADQRCHRWMRRSVILGSRCRPPRQQCQSGSLPPVASRSGPVHALVH
jgi:hypothetical protein